MTRETALYRLLLSLFSTDELRQWLRSDAEASVIVPHLAGPTATVGALFGEVVKLLAWRRLVDRGFFTRLRDARPRQAAEIDRVAALWEGGAAASTPAASPGGASVLQVHQHGDEGGQERPKK